MFGKPISCTVNPAVEEEIDEAPVKKKVLVVGARGIAVNVVAPGAIETDFGGGTVRDNAQVNAFIAAQTALGRAGQPDDIGGVIAALLAPGTGWINAQRIEAARRGNKTISLAASSLVHVATDALC